MIKEPTELDWALTELDMDAALDILRRNNAAAAVRGMPVRPLAKNAGRGDMLADKGLPSARQAPAEYLGGPKRGERLPLSKAAR